MKKYMLQFLATSAVILCMIACSDNDYMELDKGSTPLTISVDNSSIVLSEENYASDAIVLSWTSGTNYGTGQKIYYTLEIAREGTNFTNAYRALDNVTQEYTWTKTVESLNEIMTTYFGLSGGENISLEARISAEVDGQELQTATTQFSVTAYTPVTTTLYLIGDATPNGWSADNATEMTRTSNGIFSWEGNLTVGNFKFITTLGSFVPSYNKGTDGKLVYRSSDDEPDEQFYIEEDHYYQMTANLLTGVLTLAKAEGETPAYDNLYFVGDMTDWYFVPMTRDALDDFLFRYGRYFDTGGEFKFGTAEGSWENMYKATVANASYTDTSMEWIAGFDPDNKWYLNADETGKAYKICVDIRSGRERMLMHVFTPYEMIYLIGDATSAGWTISDALPMTATDSPYVFTWTGSLGTGELKFTCDKQEDWNGAWFMSAVSGQVPTGEEEKMLFIDKSDPDCADQYLDIAIGNVDQKWNITSSGTYAITLNQLEETITIAKQ